MIKSETKTFVFCLLQICFCLISQTGYAFSEAVAFGKDASADPTSGGGGLYFTGSPRFHGLSCAVCHVDGSEDIELRLKSAYRENMIDLTQDGYEPGKTYELEIAFSKDQFKPLNGCENAEHEPCNLNSFALEILDGQNQPAGTFCPVEPDPKQSGCAACSTFRANGSWVFEDCTVVVADSFNTTNATFRNGHTATSFFWRAPSRDVGELKLYLSAVDGRGQEVEDGEHTSFAHDGVTSAQISLPLNGAQSCASSAISGWNLLLLLSLLYRKPQKRLEVIARDPCEKSK